MQVHHEPRAAPALALAGIRWNKKRMQTHAPNACITILSYFLPSSPGHFHRF
ncbi:acetyl xylan esterase [Enterobacter hormaechei]|nr:acetyl xylan esterase [Enterobacter hormaechei]